MRFWIGFRFCSGVSLRCLGPDIKPVGSSANSIGKGNLNSIKSGGKRLLCGFLLLLSKASQHVAGELCTRNPAYSYLEAGKIPGTQVRNEAAEPIVPSRTPTHAEAKLAQREGNLVANYQNLLGGDLVKAGCGSHRPTTQVHIGLGLKQEKTACRPAHFGLPFLLPLEGKTRGSGQPVQHLKPHVVPRSAILPARVSQAHHKAGHI